MKGSTSKSKIDCLRMGWVGQEQYLAKQDLTRLKKMQKARPERPSLKA